jgi:hypothetical protein
MKQTLIVLVITIFGFSSCEKPVISKIVIPDGTYYGTFQRNLNTGEGEKANISITFAAGKWIGQSDMLNYPALCHGTYKISDDILIFENECAFTANFDWSLILSGEYNFTLIEDSLIIYKVTYNHEIATYYDIFSVSLPKTGIKQSPVNGKWVETVMKTDTMVFATEYNGLFPVFTLNRGFIVTDSLSLPKYFSGPYWYIIGDNSISTNWFLSSNSAFNRYYFKIMPGGDKFKIGNFFTDPSQPLERDTLTFIKLF